MNNAKLASSQPFNYKWAILAIVGLIWCCPLILFAFLIWLGPSDRVVIDPAPFYNARVTDMRPCLGLNTDTGQPIDAMEPFSMSDKQMQVCAHLEVEYIGPTGYSVPLHFTWRYRGEAVSWSLSRMYAPGYITDSFKPNLGEYISPGEYQVEVYNGRSLLASTQIMVVSGQ